MSLVLDTGAMKYRENPNQPWRPLVIKANMNWESMADTYDPDNGTYEIGRYVLEEGVMYRCIYEIDTPETWTPAHWTEIDIGDELFSLRNSISSEATTRASEDTLIKNTLNHKADAIYDIASGDIASFPDGADGLPVKDLTVGIEPVQSGTGDPSPTNVRPISGWTGANVSRTGKNLFDKDSLDNVNDYPDRYNSYDYCAPIYLKPNTQYVMSPTSTSQLGVSSYYVLIRNNDPSDPTVIAPTNADTVYPVTAGVPNTVTITTGPTGVVRFGIPYTSKETSLAAFMSVNYQLEAGSIATEYEPYNPGSSVTPISWQTEAGAVYGGTLDVTTGVLTVTMAQVDLGTLSWVKSNNWFSVNITDGKPTRGVVIEKIICSNYKTVAGTAIVSHSVDYSIGCGTNTKTEILLWDSSKWSMTAEEFKAAMSGVQLVYELATTQTYQLDPVTVTTLLGQNNVWADCGPSTAEYPCDTKLYIERLTAPEEYDMIADANIASGKYFIVNNNLYLSTAAILAGDPIKPGTNCTLTNLAAALNAINS